MRKSILNFILLFVFGVVGGIFADQILWPYFVERPLFYQYDLDSRSIKITEYKETIVQENTALQDAVQKTNKVVVAVRSSFNGIVTNGSALIVSSDGLLVMLSDIVPSGAETKLFWDGKSSSFQVLKRDIKSRLALIKMEGSGLSTAEFADMSKIRLGGRIFSTNLTVDSVFNIRVSVNEGIIKSLDDNLIQTNITDKSALGSPIFDIEGRIVGLSIVDKNGNVTILSADKIKEFIGF